MNHNFYALIDAVARQYPNKICLDDDNGRSLSFAGLLSLTSQISAFLRAAGISPGERVVVQTEKTFFGVALYLACLRCGIIYIPLNTSYTSEEVEYFLGDAGPRLFVCDSSSLEKLQTR